MSSSGTAALLISVIAALIAAVALYLALSTSTEDHAARVAAAETALAEAKADRTRLLRQIANLQQQVTEAEARIEERQSRQVAALEADIARRDADLNAMRAEFARRFEALEVSPAKPAPSDLATPEDAQVRDGLAAYGLACGHKDLDVVCTVSLIGADRPVAVELFETVGQIATKAMRCVSIDNGLCASEVRQVGTDRPTVLAFTLPSFEYAPKVEEVVRLDLGGRVFEWKDVPIGSE